MSRYTGPAYKKSRRLGFSTLENGKELAKKPYAPGAHGQDRRRKLSDYGVQLQEKQKVRIMYGLTEKQFRRTFDKAAKQKGITGENLLILLESRLDNLVFRLGMARTRRSARQIVNHGHILVNGNKVDIPSYSCKVGDVISVKEKALNHPAIKDAIEYNLNTLPFVEFNKAKLTGKFVRFPERSELNQEITEQLIVEFYNR
ncbi:MAG: 30S ribosomal protein S4 [bacterium]